LLRLLSVQYLSCQVAILHNTQSIIDIHKATVGKQRTN
jgi:hypothetical protein